MGRPLVLREDSVGVPKRYRFVDRRYGLSDQAVLDVGCGRGEYLGLMGAGSVGLELDGRLIEEGRQRGLDIRQWNFEEGLPQDLQGAFDVVWCSNLLEHSPAPHELLLRLRTAFRAEGVLLVAVPVVHRIARGAWHGFLAHDHVSFFTPRTAALTIERAGFSVEWVASGSAPGLPLWVCRLLTVVSPGVVVAARPIPDFAYPEKSPKRLIDGRIEYE